jgi:hypothetical protein
MIDMSPGAAHYAVFWGLCVRGVTLSTRRVMLGATVRADPKAATTRLRTLVVLAHMPSYFT